MKNMSKTPPLKLPGANTAGASGSPSAWERKGQRGKALPAEPASKPLPHAKFPLPFFPSEAVCWQLPAPAGFTCYGKQPRQCSWSLAR